MCEHGYMVFREIPREVPATVYIVMIHETKQWSKVDSVHATKEKAIQRANDLNSLKVEDSWADITMQEVQE